MVPSGAAAMALGERNLAVLPCPSANPGPRPASVLTVPSSAIFLTREPPETYRFPAASYAKPVGPKNRAEASGPSMTA